MLKKYCDRCKDKIIDIWVEAQLRNYWKYTFDVGCYLLLKKRRSIRKVIRMFYEENKYMKEWYLDGDPEEEKDDDSELEEYVV